MIAHIIKSTKDNITPKKKAQEVKHQLNWCLVETNLAKNL